MSLQMIFKDSKGRLRDDVLWKIVPYTWRSDRKWPMTHGRKASSTNEQYRWRCQAYVCIAQGNQLFIGEVWRRRSVYTFEHEYCEFKVNPFLCLQPVKLTEKRSDEDQTSTTSKLVEQLHSSLTGAAEENVEEYWPVSCYHSPDDWGQVMSPVTEPRGTGLDTERRMERSCLSTAKQVDTVFLTWKLIDMSESWWIPRSRTAADGVMKSVPTRSRACGC